MLLARVYMKQAERDLKRAEQLIVEALDIKENALSKQDLALSLMKDVAQYLDGVVYPLHARGNQ